MTSAEHLANLREDNATLRAGLSTLLLANRLLTAFLRVSLETIVDNVFGVGFFPGSKCRQHLYPSCWA